MRVGTRVRLSPIDDNYNCYSDYYIGKVGTVIENNRDSVFVLTVKFDCGGTQTVILCDAEIIYTRDIESNLEIKDLF